MINCYPVWTAVKHVAHGIRHGAHLAAVHPMLSVSIVCFSTAGGVFATMPPPMRAPTPTIPSWPAPPREIISFEPSDFLPQGATVPDDTGGYVRNLGNVPGTDNRQDIGYTPSPNISRIPEPSTVALLAGAFGLLAVFKASVSFVNRGRRNKQIEALATARDYSERKADYYQILLNEAQLEADIVATENEALRVELAHALRRDPKTGRITKGYVQ